MASITSRSFVASPVPVGAVFSARGSKITRQREITFPSSGGRVQWHGDRATLRVAHQLTLTIHQTPKQSARGKWFLRLEGIGVDTPVSLTGLFRFLATKQGIKEKELVRIGRRIAAVWSRMVRESAQNERRRRKPTGKRIVANWRPLFGERCNFEGMRYLSRSKRVTRKGTIQVYAHVVSPRGTVRERWFKLDWLESRSSKWSIAITEPPRETLVGSSTEPGRRSTDHCDTLIKAEKMKAVERTAETPFVCRGGRPIAKPLLALGTGSIPVSSPALWSRQSDAMEWAWIQSLLRSTLIPAFMRDGRLGYDGLDTE